MMNNLTIDVKTTKWDHVFSLTWLYFILFPTGTVFNISVPLLLLFLYDKRYKGCRFIKPLMVLLIPTAIVSLGQPYMEFKSYIRLISIAIVFYTFASYKGSKIFFPYIFFAICYIFLSQISIVLNLPYLASFYDNTYNIIESTLESAQINITNSESSDLGIGSRMGGIFINSNNCGSYLSLIYATGLCSENQLQGKSRLLLYIFIVLTAIAIFITGSRTAFVVFSIISLYYLYSKGFNFKYFLILSIILIVVFLSVNLADVRMLKVQEGIEGSVSTKMEIFVDYLTNSTNPLLLLFGAGDTAITNWMLHTGFDGTDFDFGNVFIVFGFTFYFFYLLFIVQIYRKMSITYRVFVYVLLWSLSNSILCSYRMCPVFFMTLGLFYRQSIVMKSLSYDRKV